MIMDQGYSELGRRVKAVQRDNVVRLVFGGQSALAQLLGVTQSTVNHVIWLRRRSAPIERFVIDQVRRVRPDLVEMWELPESNGKKRAA